MQNLNFPHKIMLNPNVYSIDPNVNIIDLMEKALKAHNATSDFLKGRPKRTNKIKDIDLSGIDPGNEILQLAGRSDQKLRELEILKSISSRTDPINTSIIFG